jgi:hypothetical protein
LTIFGIVLNSKGTNNYKSADGENLSEVEFLKYYADINAVLPIEKEDYFVNVIILNIVGD